MSQPYKAQQSERWQAAIRAINKAEQDLGNIPTGGSLMERFANSIKRQRALAKAGQGIKPVVSPWHNVIGAMTEGRAAKG